MRTLTYSEARQKLAKTMDRVCDDRDAIIITRRSKRDVVMMSQEDYVSLMETAQLLRSPRNAQRLLESIRELETGRGRERQLRE